MEGFNELPDIIRWAAYGLALFVIIWLAVYVFAFLAIIAATVIDAVSDARRAKRHRKAVAARRAKEQAAFQARRNGGSDG